MRLLHTKDLVFKDFIGQNIPPYAIISHRWSDEEITYSEFLNDRLKLLNGQCKGYGWSKIAMGCTIAHQDGYDWMWIDTICINKTSSAELSEAINSMYTWYQQSAICYAFLPDVRNYPSLEESKKTINILGEHHSSFVRDDFMSSDWFQRSWTLQELLAPRLMHFYSLNFDLIGSKNALAHLISETTGIKVHYLHPDDRSVLDASVAERMSFASSRRATRIEDVAYSLLGLFDVSMPLLYGEGERAFLRLQQEIIKVSDDESILCWSRITRIPSSSPLAPHPGAFVSSTNIQTTSLIPRSHYEMTNKGLRCTLDISEELYTRCARVGRAVVLMPLNCVYATDVHRVFPIAIRLCVYPRGSKFLVGIRFGSDQGLVYGLPLSWTIFDEAQRGIKNISLAACFIEYLESSPPMRCDQIAVASDSTSGTAQEKTIYIRAYSL